MNCAGAADSSFTVDVRDGTGTAIGPTGGAYSSYDVRVEATATGDLTGDGDPETAVLLYCSPQPSNYYLQEVQVFGSNSQLLGGLTPVGELAPGLEPQYDPSGFSVQGGRLVTRMNFYGPSDNHVPGPTIPRTLSWRWEEQRFVSSPPTISVTVPLAAPDGDSIAVTLSTYFNGINDGDYAVAFRQLGPGAGGNGSPSTFAEAVRATVDSDVRVVDASTPGTGQATVDVNFTSHQAAEKGPRPGQTCDQWGVRYTMIQESDGHWLMNGSEGRDGQPKYPPC